MRILFLNTYKDWGGDEKWTINIGKGLKAKGHFVVIASNPGLETEKRALENGLDIFGFNAGPDIAFWKIPKFRRYLRDNRIDVVICVQNRDVKIGALAAKLEGIRLVLGRHALDALKRNRRYHKFAYTRYLDGIILNSHALANHYRSFGWFKDEFLHPVHDGIEIQEHVEDVDLKSMFNLPVDCVVMVGAGRLVHQKGFDLLVKVAKLAKEKSLNWRFIIIGKGQLEQELNQLSKNLDVEEYIKFVGFRKDVLPVMKAADLFVLSSRSESMTNVLREAMSVETACVATDVQGISELIEHGKSGYVVAPESEFELFNGIKHLLDHSELKEKIEKNSILRIKEAFTMQRMVDEIEALIIRLLAKKGHKVS